MSSRPIIRLVDRQLIRLVDLECEDIPLGVGDTLTLHWNGRDVVLRAVYDDVSRLCLQVESGDIVIEHLIWAFENGDVTRRFA